MKLTDKIKIEESERSRLTSLDELPFIVSFKYKLQNGYSFKNLKPDNLKAFQNFLDKVSEMKISQVDKMFLRKPDHQDNFNGKQMQHYEVQGKFRIHGIYENTRFKVIRLDPGHKKHK